MAKDRLIKIIEKLTGKGIKFSRSNGEDFPEHILIERVLKQRPLSLGHKEFNEILLIFNKDRISKDFFDYFLLANKPSKTLNIDELEKRVDDFRKLSILLFGNFIYAYKLLSKLNKVEIKKELGRFSEKPITIINRFKNRPRSLQNIEKIKKDHTYLLGYLSEGNIEVNLKTAIEIQKACDGYNPKKTKKNFCKFILSYIKQNHRKYPTKKQEKIIDLTETILRTYFDNNPINSNAFTIFINKAVLEIVKLNSIMEKVQRNGIINTDIYLTWDHMDIYLATSMRRKWEYDDFFTFVDSLFKDKKLSTLKLRYFDPTQSYDKSRVDKGLVEGLMLKRAKCTVYSSQETDTLGKDSELAATLAQGKPVIAYIPRIKNTNQYAIILEGKPLKFFIYKIRLLHETFEKFEVKKECLNWLKNNKSNIKNAAQLETFINNVNVKISKYIDKKAWNSIDTPWAKDIRFKKQNRKNFSIFSHLIAIADKYFYDSRANTLKNIHPLGLQVNLDSGVANGVLVVREIDKCAQLLYNLLTNQLKFNLFHNDEKKYWYLEESISQSIYRVVTDDIKLTNTFWNFYIKDERIKHVTKSILNRFD